MKEEAVLDAEVMIGELTAKIEKASGGDRKSVPYDFDAYDYLVFCNKKVTAVVW